MTIPTSIAKYNNISEIKYLPVVSNSKHAIKRSRFSIHLYYNYFGIAVCVSLTIRSFVYSDFCCNLGIIFILYFIENCVIF